MPIFNVYQINETHLAKVRACRATSVMGSWNPAEGSQPNPGKLTFNEWRRYIRKTLCSKKTPSYLSTTVEHIAI